MIPNRSRKCLKAGIATDEFFCFPARLIRVKLHILMSFDVPKRT
jgi:hypothetical protein